MSSRLGLHAATPLMFAPATAAWAAPMAAYYIFLQNRVVYHRVKGKSYMGDNSEHGTTDPLYIATRCQLNFIENVPLVLLLGVLAELNGANRNYISIGMGVLFASRISHAEFGLMGKESMSIGRPIGYYGTTAVTLSFAGYLSYLVSGYWY